VYAAGDRGRADKSIVSEFDQHRLSLVSKEQEEGWQAEICWYLKDLPANVTKDSDVVAWWQVHVSHVFIFLCYLLFSG
jgi:hypothetical protein